ncbi:MAG TPA: c-type cytochrome [Gemmatimonadaceae bacterium]|nr:c-type cytochrome [Gemmatimonadaceae bacterium]
MAAVLGLAVVAFVPPPRGDAGRGKAVYDRFCTQCHGANGDGAGEVAQFANPKPRDFRQGLFKFRSTPFGSLPTDADLDRTVRDGLYGTAMPPFYALAPAERADVIAYVQTFSARWRNEKPGTPITIAPEPAATTESVERGRGLFEKTCGSCHGDGSGNGPLAKSLVDAWGNADPPADLRKGRTKTEVTGSDIYLRIVTGLNGTPMPGFANALSPEQTWDIVHYVESLGPWKESTVHLRPPSMSDSVVGNAGNAGNAGNTPAATVTIEMVADASGYKFVPNSVTIHAGETVRFVNKIGGPHNVTFWPDSIPAGTQQKLQRGMQNPTGPLTSPLLTNTGDATTVSFDGVTPGTYKFYCMPHQAFGMKGQIIVQ